MSFYIKIGAIAFGYASALIGGWFLGLDYAAVSCQQDMEFSSEGVRYVCTPAPSTGELK